MNKEINESIMEDARALMDLFPGLDLVDAICAAKRNQELFQSTHK